MATRRTAPRPSLLIALLAALSAISSPSFAGEEPQAAEGQNSSVASYYTLDAAGEVVFTQVLSWDPDPNALRFEVVIKDAGDQEILQEFTEAAKLDIRLPPGTYTYNLVTWNLLNQRETESGWQPLVIIKAEIPVLSDTSPSSLYMDALNGNITLKGQKLVPGARFYLRDSTGKEIEGREVEREGDGEIVVVFPDRAYQPGSFDLVVVNPGGLKAVSEQCLRIKYQRPVDIIVSLGYSPIAFFHDQWVRENWPDPVYWSGVNAGLSVYFVKKSWGFLGVEAAVADYRLSGGTDQATLTSNYLLAGLNLAYKYRFSRTVHGVARIGAGLSLSTHSFDYNGSPGPETSSSDPCFDVGLMVQYFLPHKVILEAGTDWIEILQNSHAIGGLRPTLRVGYQLF